MKTAYCMEDRNNHHAHEFVDHPDRERLRYHLRCPDQNCKGKAYFRIASTDGKPACFGARHHSYYCENRTQGSPSQSREASEKEVRRLKANMQAIHVIWGGNNLNNTQPSSNPRASEGTSSGTARRHTQEPALNKKVRSRLGPLLTMLIDTEKSAESVRFSSSEIEIHTGGEHPFKKAKVKKAKDFFVKFDAINEEDLEQWRGYWGVIKEVGTTSKNGEITTWLNTRKRTDHEKNVGIPVEGLKKSKGLVGSFALVFGQLKKSEEKSNWYLKYDNDKICIKRSKIKR